MASFNTTYYTLSDIQARKRELQAEINKKGEQISDLWTKFFTPPKANTKGEMVATIISNGITAFDTFMLVRKLMNRYGHLFGGKRKR